MVLKKKTQLSHDSYLFRFEYEPFKIEPELFLFDYEKMHPKLDPVWSIKLGYKSLFTHFTARISTTNSWSTPTRPSARSPRSVPARFSCASTGKGTALSTRRAVG